MHGPTISSISQGPPPPPIDRGWGGGDGPDGGRGGSRRASLAGLLILLVSIAVIFAAFTVAFLARRSSASDWVSIPKPPILLVNSALLIASSLVLDVSRRALRRRNRARFNLWWSLATALGVAFLAGQAYAWVMLQRAGVGTAGNPNGSFFYLLTAAHAVHLLGGVAALIYVDVQAWRLQLGPAKRTTIDVTAIYWHFLDGLWLYLMVLFYVWG